MLASAIVARECGACVEFGDRWDNPQLDRYGRAGAQQGTRLAIVECIRFMATKHTITPRGALLKSHLHGGVVVRRKRMTAPSPERPMRTVCAWCVEHDRPAAVLVDVPIDDRGLSHGICPSCLSLLRSDSWAVGGSSDASSTWR